MLKRAFQRAVNGYDERAIWSLDIYLADLIVKVLTKTKYQKTLHAQFYSEDLSHEECRAEQLKAFDKIIVGFQAYIDLNENTYDVFEHDALEELYKEGMETFSKYFETLWT